MLLDINKEVKHRLIKIYNPKTKLIEYLTKEDAVVLLNLAARFGVKVGGVKVVPNTAKIINGVITFNGE